LAFPRLRDEFGVPLFSFAAALGVLLFELFLLLFGVVLADFFGDLGWWKLGRDGASEEMYVCAFVFLCDVLHIAAASLYEYPCRM
jgi:hypothetical protein